MILERTRLPYSLRFLILVDYFCKIQTYMANICQARFEVLLGAYKVPPDVSNVKHEITDDPQKLGRKVAKLIVAGLLSALD